MPPNMVFMAFMLSVTFTTTEHASAQNVVQHYIQVLRHLQIDLDKIIFI